MSRQSSVHQLPDTILVRICEESKKEDIPNFRLISKACADPGAKVLFRPVHLSTHSRTIEYFEQITSHPHLLKHVEELNYDDSAFNSALLDFPSFYSLTERHGPNCINDSPEFPEHALDAANKRQWYARTEAACDHDPLRVEEVRLETAKRVHEWVSERITEHMVNRAANRDVEVLQKAIRRGLRVKRVTLTSLPAGLDYEDRPDKPPSQSSRSPAMRQWEADLPEHGGLVPLQEIIPRVNWATLDSALPDILVNHASNLQNYSLYRTGPTLSEWQAGRDAGRPDGVCYHPLAVMAPYRGLWHLLQTFDTPSTSVSDFRIIPSRKAHPFCAQQVESSMSAAMLLAAGPTRQKLTTLISRLKTLHLSMGVVSHLDGTVFDYKKFTGMLQGAQSLEDLYLHVVDHQYYSIPTLIRGLRFKHLRRLHVSDLGFTDRDFFVFVHEHRCCLHELIVFYCRVLDAEGGEGDAWWWPVLDELRRRRCFSDMGLYLNKLQEPRHGGMLEMDGNPERDEGMVVWKRWVDGEAPFPLGAGSYQNGNHISDADYRVYLREVLPG